MHLNQRNANHSVHKRGLGRIADGEGSCGFPPRSAALVGHFSGHCGGHPSPFDGAIHFAVLVVNTWHLVSRIRALVL